MNRVLFLCTGNYYRSRFAEAVFNHYAKQNQLAWRAFSRGLAVHLAPDDCLSNHTRAALTARNIPVHLTGADKAPATEDDLRHAAIRIALKEAEHRPYIHAFFPEWEEKIVYWHVHDLDETEADQALPEIEALVLELVKDLSKKGQKPPSAAS